MLQMARWCDRWGAPYSGGAYNQPLADIVQMMAASNVYRVYKSYAKADNTPEWEDNNPEDAAIYRIVENIREGGA